MFFFFKIIYFRESMSRGRSRGRGRETQADCLLSVKPNVGLNPRTPRPLPEPKSRVGQVRNPTD